MAACTRQQATVHRLWSALAAGEVVQRSTFEAMRTAKPPQGTNGYGLGFWLNGHVVALEGMDPGVSFYTSFEPATARSLVVISKHQRRCVADGACI